MVAPRAQDEKLKRILRYLRTAPRQAALFSWKALEDTIVVCVDAVGSKTRKSTLGGALVWTGSYIKSWSKTMDTLALSSGESELGAVVKGFAEALGLKSILEDYGFHAKISLRSDATAAIGMVRRRGFRPRTACSDG